MITQGLALFFPYDLTKGNSPFQGISGVQGIPEHLAGELTSTSARLSTDPSSMQIFLHFGFFYFFFIFYSFYFCLFPYAT